MIIFCSVCFLIIPLTMLFCGLWMWKSPPQDINHWFGYRTAWSMKNTDTWAFAHNYCGKLWLQWGIVTTLLSLLIAFLLFQRTQNEDAWAVALLIVTLIQTLILLLSIVPVERALKQTFDDFGNRR